MVTLMDKPEYLQTLVQVAIMYYNENLTQQEISSKLKTTRQTVSKLINEARNRGIVQIKIHNPLNDIETLALRLEETFNINKAIVLPGNFTDESLTRSIIAQRATEYISRLIDQKTLNIGLSWGRTVYNFIQFFEGIEKCRELNIFPLVGASSEAAPYFMVNEMIRVFAEKLHAKPNFIYSPVNPGSSEEYGLFSRTLAYRTIASLWKKIDLAIVGIGSFHDKLETSRQEYPGEREIASNLISKNVIGDICTNYFDIDGNIIKPSDYHRLISISEEDLRKVKRIVALAGGLEKVDAIIGALKTGLITDIILDEKTAREIFVRI
jgi:DNA-binding transcriptional regulator LsrR (DeoR family)